MKTILFFLLAMSPIAANAQAIRVSGGNVPNSSIDGSSITKRGNTFNGSNQLVLLDSNGNLQLPVTGAHFSSITVAGGMFGVNATSASIAGALRVNGALTVPSGALTVSAGNINISAGTLNARQSGGSDGGLIAVFDEDSGEDAVTINNPTTAFAIPTGNQVLSVAGDARGASISAIGWAVISGTLTVSNYFIPYSRTRAQLNTLVPGLVGAQVFCSNCATNGDMCVSTGTTAGQWRRIGTALGCDE